MALLVGEYEPKSVGGEVITFFSRNPEPWRRRETRRGFDAVEWERNRMMELFVSVGLDSLPPIPRVDAACEHD